MELNQITKRVTWLDEERRRDKDEIARLKNNVRRKAVRHLACGSSNRTNRPSSLGKSARICSVCLDLKKK